MKFVAADVAVAFLGRRAGSHVGERHFLLDLGGGVAVLLNSTAW